MRPVSLLSILALSLSAEASIQPKLDSQKFEVLQAAPFEEVKREIKAKPQQTKPHNKIIPSPAKTQNKTAPQGFTPVDSSPYFDLPVTYNSKVKVWINYFQTNGRASFKQWLERSARYLPKITPMLEKQGLPKDLAYLAMIESGFSPRAVSTASAVGYWQFIAPTANRYGLRTDWWLDERRDIVKSTIAAARYLNDLYRMFNSWYLAAAAYNMGENRVKRLIEKYQTRNYWVLSRKKDFPAETADYIPKLIAAMLIAKAPELYGFQDLKLMRPYEYEYFNAPGGTDLENLAHFMNIDREALLRLNPELVKGFIPQFVDYHRIRLPKGTLAKAREFVRASL